MTRKLILVLSYLLMAEGALLFVLPVLDWMLSPTQTEMQVFQQHGRLYLIAAMLWGLALLTQYRMTIRKPPSHSRVSRNGR